MISSSFSHSSLREDFNYYRKFELGYLFALNYVLLRIIFVFLFWDCSEFHFNLG